MSESLAQLRPQLENQNNEYSIDALHFGIPVTHALGVKEFLGRDSPSSLTSIFTPETHPGLRLGHAFLIKEGDSTLR